MSGDSECSSICSVGASAKEGTRLIAPAGFAGRSLERSAPREGGSISSAQSNLTASKGSGLLGDGVLTLCEAGAGVCLAGVLECAGGTRLDPPGVDCGVDDPAVDEVLA